MEKDLERIDNDDMQHYTQIVDSARFNRQQSKRKCQHVAAQGVLSPILLDMQTRRMQFKGATAERGPDKVKASEVRGGQGWLCCAGLAVPFINDQALDSRSGEERLGPG